MQVAPIKAEQEEQKLSEDMTSRCIVSLLMICCAHARWAISAIEWMTTLACRAACGRVVQASAGVTCSAMCARWGCQKQWTGPWRPFQHCGHADVPE